MMRYERAMAEAFAFTLYNYKFICNNTNIFIEDNIYICYNKQLVKIMENI